MLSFISWKVFIEVLGVLLAAYYLMVFALYYPQETWALLRRKKTTPDSLPEKNSRTNRDDEAKETGDTGPAEFALTEKIVMELKETIKKVMEDGVEKEDLLSSMAHVLGKYRKLKNTTYGKAINNMIIRECRSNYAVHLDEGEVERLWADL